MADAPEITLEEALTMAELAVIERGGRPLEGDCQPWPCFTVAHLRVLTAAAHRSRQQEGA